MVKAVGPIPFVPTISVLSIQLFNPFYYKIFAFFFPITTCVDFGCPPVHCAARRNNTLFYARCFCFLYKDWQGFVYSLFKIMVLSTIEMVL